METPDSAPPTPTTDAETDRLRAELASEAFRADGGELARPLAHEFNNFLNNLLLNLAILEQAGGEAPGTGLARLRRQADQIAGLIKEFHDFRGRHLPPPRPIDVNAALRAAADLLARDYPDLFEGRLPAGAAGALTVAATATPRPLTGHAPDAVRLFVFLLKNALQAARAAGGVLRAETAVAADGVTVKLDLSAVKSTADPAARLFESLAASVHGVSALELAACASIARRFRGKFHAEALPEGGLRIVFEAPNPA
ncbi:MAG: hypothetical protein ACJ8F7_22370 [Gemmataceae bacterium]